MRSLVIIGVALVIGIGTAGAAEPEPTDLFVGGATRVTVTGDWLTAGGDAVWTSWERTLLRLDPAPYQLTLARAEAEIDSARAAVEQLKASLREIRAEAKEAENKLAYLQTQARRQRELSKTGVTSGRTLSVAIEKSAVTEAAPPASGGGATVGAGGSIQRCCGRSAARLILARCCTAVSH